MFKLFTFLACFAAMCTLAVCTASRGQKAEQPAPAIPEMKFNEVKEVAPGVFFRYSSISATDPKVPFGGCNNIWVVFKDYVFVVDANFPKEAGDVIADIKKTTKKPIKYVLDTHHHGDHAYGNNIWAKEGAQIIASSITSRLLKVNGPKQWEEASKGPKGRDDLKKSELKQADITFDEKYVLDDGAQRVEIFAIGHAHTSGDAVAYLPKLKVLCTGDACVNGAFNFMGHSNSAAWIICLDKLQKLDVDLVCPGHGKVSKKDLLATQQRYFADMRAHIKKGIDDKKTLDAIGKSLDLPWYKEWTGKDASTIKDNIKHVYDELTGKIDHDRIGFGPAPLNWTAERPAVAGRESSGASADK
ncbi:MAG TPA: MBL fold metallo-hydrolase [Gemmataceae bacterium]|nr:MBL fold metallo-hydrolase [Gemmataceae bacterium]